MDTSSWAIRSIMATGVVLVLFVAYALARVFHHDAKFATVAVLILVGLAAFIAIMNVISVTANLMGITDAKQPFGLPEGTVRAILTMAFIVLVGVFASFLLTSSATREPFGEKAITLSGIDRKDADAFVQRYLADGLAAIKPSAEGKVDIEFHPRRDYRLADDVAKQILTILSTILAAMIGFYFGAQTPTAAAQRPGEPDERSNIEKDLVALGNQLQTLRKAANEKLPTVAEAKRPQVQAVIDSLGKIEQKITVARDTARDLSQPIDKVRAAYKEAQAAAADLDGQKQKLHDI